MTFKTVLMLAGNHIYTHFLGFAKKVLIVNYTILSYLILKNLTHYFHSIVPEGKASRPFRHDPSNYIGSINDISNITKTIKSTIGLYADDIQNNQFGKLIFLVFRMILYDSLENWSELWQI